MQFEAKVPDIGDFDQVEVIEVLVAAGDEVDVEDSLITLESDKASMEVPAERAGTIASVAVAVGDQVGEGALIAVIEVTDSEAESAEVETEETEEQYHECWRQATILVCRSLRIFGRT